ncbi:MAG: alpha/beta hydrolase [Desulfobacterales bacterium]|nr:alpha/beta hydrolase [Desulfobacterales bacterium]
MNRVLVVFLATMCLFYANLVHAGCEDISNEIIADNSCTKIRTYRSADVTDKPILVVALHGDSPFNNPGYQYRFAELVANKNSNVISVGMLRPGYTDPLGRTSDGIKGDAIGDNYDEKRVNQIAQAITKLEKLYSPSKVILAGHSGGAAITANLISLFPLLIDHAFIVSCPCDVNVWREDMFSLTNKSIFNTDFRVAKPC